MKVKRILTLLLVACMLMTAIAPGVSAVKPGETVHVNTEKKEDVQSADSKWSGATLFRPEQADEEEATGHWAAEKTNTSRTETFAELPQHLQELQQAANIYGEEDLVAAFIVLEDAPLAEKQYASMADAPADEVEALLAKQAAVISAIEKDVLAGEALQVRHQFTYLTNAVTVNVQFGKLTEIAKVSGVETVFLATVYSPAEAEKGYVPMTDSSGAMTGVPSVWEDLGFTGTGMKVAVIDTGLDLDHPSFAADPETNDDSMVMDDIAAVVESLNAYKMASVSAEKLYRSVKVPYAFNYVDRNYTADHDHDTMGDHGTHVSGIVAANHTEGTAVVGMAPDAQILVMKVFGASGGAYMDDIVAALEDAMTLGADVVNMSLGSAAGFATANPEMDAIYARIKNQNIIVAVAAGNEGVSSDNNMLGTGENLTSDPDDSTVSSPATFANTTAVASAENASIMSPYFTVSGEKVAYTDATGLYVTFDSIGYEEAEYVMVPGVGNAEDFDTVDVMGKIAVVSRGNINFSLKLANAEAAGAIALVVYNNASGNIGMQMTDDEGNLSEGVSGMVPAVSVSQAAGALLAAAEQKVLSVGEGMAAVPSENAGQLSDFSSWGVSGTLELLPDITAIGGNVYSTVNNGEYDVMSGTSMATPQLAGIAALVMQYLKETYDLPGTQLREIAESLLMSTSVPVIDHVSGVEASPRQQGSGLVNALNAVTSGAYLTVDGSTQPKASLGDDVSRTGTYSFTFTIHNMDTAAKTYALSSSLLTEDVNDYGEIVCMALHDTTLDGTVSFSQNTVTVAPGGEATVTVTVQVSEAGKAWLNQYYGNGGYVEGFVYAESENDVDLSLPFLAFFGDWTEAPLMDEGFWYDESFWDETVMPSAKEFYNVVWTPLGQNAWVIGGNPYTGTMAVEGERAFVISNNGDGYLDALDDIYFSHMRNADTLTVTFSNLATGEVYREATLTHLNKTMYNSSYGQIVPTLYSWYASEIFNFTDASGNPLPNNTQVLLSVKGTLEFDAHEQNNSNNSWEVPITVDTQSPVVTELVESTKDGRNYLTIGVSDNTAVADVLLYDATGTHLIAQYPDFMLDGAEGSYSVTVDISGLGSQFLLYVCDFGANEAAYVVRYTLDDNLPEKPESGLYAYRVSDSAFEYGDESYYGWVSIDPETAEVTQLTDDHQEMYALTAADYAYGYVFGVDAGNNFVVMHPGLWTRQIIRPLDTYVYDMSFDASTGTMYALSKDENQNAYLNTIDLLTGELTLVTDLGYYGAAPLNIAAVDGEIYCILNTDSGLYKLDTAWGDVEWLADLGDVSPSYAQSMTYSKEANALYWTYYKFSWWSTSAATLYTISLDDYSYTTSEFDSYMEFIGLTTLEDPNTSSVCDGENCPSAQFEDVKQSAYYHEAVDFVVSEGLMNGTSDTKFSPYSSMTRAMLVTVLYRMAGEPAVTSENVFTDVPSGSWYENAVIWASETGITTGTSAATFGPGGTVNREQAVTFLYRYATYAGADVTTHYDSLDAYTDASTVSAWAKDAMRWAVGAGLINGTSDTTLSPKDSCNRAQLAVMLMRLDRSIMGDWSLPVNPISQILMDESATLSVGAVYAPTVLTLPWNTPAILYWESSDESVVTVDDGVFTAVAPGEAVVTVTCGEASAQCAVKVVDLKGTVYAFDLYNASGMYMDWIRFDLASVPGYESLANSPVAFVSADYNGHDGCIYGYDEQFQLYRYNPETGDCTALGAPNSGMQITDLAYDYSTGLMYASVFDQTYGECMLVNVSMVNGMLMPAAMDYDGNVWMTLACSTDGQLYGINSEGNLYALTVDEDYGMVVSELIAELGYGELSYMQSMCYDHNNDQLVWAACLAGSAVIRLDPETGASVIVGSPTGDSYFQYTGMYTIPDEVPELPYVALEYAEADPEMQVLVGGAKAPNVTIYPLNATNHTVQWTVEDETIAMVDENGMVVGLQEGTTEMIGVIEDFELYVTVTVVKAADTVYGFTMMDMGSGGTNGWIRFSPSDTTHPEVLSYSDYTMYSAEYVDGKIYAYGYNSEDWTAEMFFFTIDAETYDIIDMIPVPNCPDVYDLTYDYTRGVMFAVAGYSDTASDLYVVDMATGTPVLLMETNPFLMTLAADENGNLLAIACSQSDEWGETFMPADLYMIDVDNMTLDLVGSTEVQSNMWTTMTYDYDSGMLYWAAFFHKDFFSPIVSGLYMVDPTTAEANYLGVLGSSGMQMGSLYIVGENYPESQPGLSAVILSPKQQILGVGGTASMSVVALGAPDATLTWSSDDETVATVENGVVTAVSGGTANITVTAEFAGVSKSATAKIVVFSEDAHMVAYSSTMGGWAGINRMDFTSVDLLSEQTVTFTAAAYVGDTIYAYDAEGTLYAVDEADGFTATMIGSCGVEADEGAVFTVRALSYNAVTGELLALGAPTMESEWGTMEGTNTIYTVDTETGALTELTALDDVQFAAMTVTADGTVVLYKAFDDGICILREDFMGYYTEEVTTLQSLSVYCDENSPQSMCYDAMTGLVYIAMTSNGRFYNLYTFDPVTNALNALGEIGQKVYNPETWVYDGDLFTALMIK